MPTDKDGRYTPPSFQLKHSQGKPNGYPKLDGEGAVLNAAGQPLATRDELAALQGSGSGITIVDNGDGTSTLTLADDSPATLVDNGDGTSTLTL